MNTNSELIKARLLKCLALSFLLVFPVIGFSQVTYPTIGRNCAEATTICTKESIIVQSTSNGDKGTGANRPSCSGLPYNQSTFMVFTVKQTGTLNFDIIPESPLSEYDWFLYDYDGCGVPNTPLTIERVCNFATNKRSAGAPANTGLSPTGQEDPREQKPYTKEIDVTKGSKYLLQVDHYGEYVLGNNPTPVPDGSLGYRLDWGGTFEMEPIRDFTINGKATDNQIFCCAPFDLNFLNTSEYLGNATWTYGNSVTGAGDATVNTYAAANTYTVTMSLATPDGCDYTRTKTVVIQPKPFMYVPNAFSPINRSDPNDKNSFFDVILPSEGIVTYSINVYDRWGKRMFTTTDPAKKWNGGMENDLGKSCPVGIYVYVIRAEFVEGSIYNRSGTVAITN